MHSHTHVHRPPRAKGFGEAIRLLPVAPAPLRVRRDAEIDRRDTGLSFAPPEREPADDRADCHRLAGRGRRARRPRDRLRRALVSEPRDRTPQRSLRVLAAKPEAVEPQRLLYKAHETDDPQPCSVTPPHTEPGVAFPSCCHAPYWSCLRLPPDSRSSTARWFRRLSSPKPGLRLLILTGYAHVESANQ